MDHEGNQRDKGYYREKRYYIVGKEFVGLSDIVANTVNALLYKGRRKDAAPESRLHRQSLSRTVRREDTDRCSCRSVAIYWQSAASRIWDAASAKSCAGTVSERYGIVIDYLAEGQSYCADRKIVHNAALIRTRMIKVLSGDSDIEDREEWLEKQEIREEDEVTLEKACEGLGTTVGRYEEEKKLF